MDPAPDSRRTSTAARRRAGPPEEPRRRRDDLDGGEPIIDEQAGAARLHDYHLGGSHHLAVDREAAERTRSEMPRVAGAIHADRAFLVRAVRYCLNAGIDQFLDLGSGIPHEPAHGHHRGFRAAVAHLPVRG